MLLETCILNATFSFKKNPIKGCKRKGRGRGGSSLIQKCKEILQMWLYLNNIVYIL